MVTCGPKKAKKKVSNKEKKVKCTYEYNLTTITDHEN